MPELPPAAGRDRLAALDAATSEARALARRLLRLTDRLEELADPELRALGRELLDGGDRLLAQLEDRRGEERTRLRRLLRGCSDEESP